MSKFNEIFRVFALVVVLIVVGTGYRLFSGKASKASGLSLFDQALADVPGVGGGGGCADGGGSGGDGDAESNDCGASCW